MKKVLFYYNFIIITIITMIGFLQAESWPQVVSAVLFFPLVIYFGQFILPQKRRALPFDEETLPLHLALAAEFSESTPPPPVGKKVSDTNVPTAEEDYQETGAVIGEILENGFDIDKRLFLKLIGSAGLTVFFFSLFTKKAHGAFFGSTPGPGTIAIKDSAGDKIDPAILQPTDGYKITQLDDSTSTAYYGFVDKSSRWFIMKEDGTGAYRYARGDSSFSTNWTGRAGLTYDYFDVTF